MSNQGLECFCSKPFFRALLKDTNVDFMLRSPGDFLGKNHVHYLSGIIYHSVVIFFLFFFSEKHEHFLCYA